MKYSRKLLLLVLVVVGGLVSMWLKSERRHEDEGPEVRMVPINSGREKATSEATTEYPSGPYRQAESTPSPFTGKLVSTPTWEPIAELARTREAKFIGGVGNINAIGIEAVVGSHDVARRVSEMMKRSVSDIWVLLRKKNGAIGEPPFQVGSKIRIEGLDSTEMAGILAALQSALAEVTSEKMSLELARRFGEAAQMYCHSLDVEVKMGTVGVISGGVARTPFLYRVVVRDQARIMTDVTRTDDPGTLVRQYLSGDPTPRRGR